MNNEPEEYQKASVPELPAMYSEVAQGLAYLHNRTNAKRPIPCRAYDCRSDTRIWLDFENKIVNPKINAPDWPHNLSVPEMELPGRENDVPRP